MDSTGHRLRVTTAFLAISAGLVSYTSLEFMLEAVQKDFSMTSDETMVVSQIAAGACLFAVFLTGVLADRLGQRRVLTIASLTFMAGALLTAAAPQPGVLLAGLCVSGVGTIAMAIVGLAILDTTFTERRARARAFGMFAVVAPVVAITVPLVASPVVSHVGWRWVTALWCALGIAAVELARRALDAHSAPSQGQELLTPILGGAALAGVALTVSFARLSASTGQHSDAAGISAIVAIVALCALVATMRVLPRPTLDLRSLRVRGSHPVLAAVFVVNGVNLFFFTYLMLQYRYHQSLLETAVILILPQATAAGGAILGGRLSARWGSAVVCITSLAVASVLSLGVLVVAVDSSALLPVLVLSVAAVPISAAVATITQSVMDLGPEDGAGATSSVRNSAANLGVAIAGLVSATIVFDELDADTARTTASYQQQTDAFHLAGAMCACAYLVAAILMVMHLRRRRGSAPSDAMVEALSPG